jgi:peptidoglycan/LPS O-acetylase OafA/YrhL
MSLGIATSVVVQVVALAFTVGLAAASYALLEAPFLRLKLRYSRIVTGEPSRSARASVA